MSENIEDEDVILENSPLNQYLSELDLGELTSDISNQKATQYSKNHSLDSLYLSIYLKSILLSCVARWKYQIKNLLLNDKIFSILQSAAKINILNDTDANYLQYLMDTRIVQWSSNYEAISPHCIIKSLTFFGFFGIVISFSFGKLAAGFFFAGAIGIYLTFIWLYGILLRYLVVFFFQRLVRLSMLSRHTILSIQELLSINQGYSKLVHLKDNSQFDCSQSFNPEMIENFCHQFFSTLTQVLTCFDLCHQNLREIVNNEASFIKEVPWLLQEEEDCEIGELDCRQPLSQLKHIHNLIQIRFSYCLKSLITWSFCLDNHPSMAIVARVICVLHQSTDLVRHLSKYRRILQIKTISNLNCPNKRETSQYLNPKSTQLINKIRTLDLHLFEISQFTRIITNELDRPTTIVDDNWVSLQQGLVDKAKNHFAAINTCWKAVYDEMESLKQQNPQELEHGKSTDHQRDEKQIKYQDGDQKVIIVDKDPEIVDEVIEGIPDVEIETLVESGGNRFIDPFQQKYDSNAKAILHELQSVIDVRAKDWRKREKLALKRRAAEGKFVFDHQQHKQLDDVKSRINKCQDSDTEIGDQNMFNSDGLNIDLRRTLGQMVLQQRLNMIADSDLVIGDEECFCD